MNTIFLGGPELLSIQNLMLQSEFDPDQNQGESPCATAGVQVISLGCPAWHMEVL